MKKLSMCVAIVALLAICSAFANSRSWPFTAPTVNGTGSVANAEQGNIIFDWISGSTGAFKGFDGSAWVTLGSSSSTLPIGTILPFAGTTAPAGFVLADGAALSRTTYADLYTAIGNAYGAGDGATTFNVPDLRGRFMRGVDGSAGNDPNASTRTASATGGNTGNNIGSIQTDDYKSHNHTSSWDGSANGSPLGSTPPGTYAIPWANSSGDDYTKATGNSGGSETRPKNIYVNYIIKY